MYCFMRHALALIPQYRERQASWNWDEKLAVNFLALIKLAAIRLWFRVYEVTSCSKNQY